MSDRFVTALLRSRVTRLIAEPENAVLVHIGFGLLWLLPGTIVTLLWLSNSVAFVAWMSLYAIVIGHWSGLQASLADLRVKGQGQSGNSGDSGSLS